MTPELQQALVLEASKLKAKAIDADVFKALVTQELDPSDSEAVEKTAKKAVEQHPHLFKFEKGWAELSQDDFQEREEQFRASLRKSHTVGPNEFASLDAATLDDEQMRALTRTLQGRGGSYDRAILQHALAEQKRLLGDAS